jgi:hypothetical protein
MATRRLLAATAAALLLLQLAAVLPVQAGGLRSLKQYWGYDPWAGSGWYGGGWGGSWSRPWDPVGRCGCVKMCPSHHHHSMFARLPIAQQCSAVIAAVLIVR